VYALIQFATRFGINWRFVFLENDSVDDTREILREFVRKFHDRFRGQMLTLASKSSLAMCRSGQRRNCRARTAFLAELRQRVMSAALQEDALMVVVLDIDYVFFSPEALINMMRKWEEAEADGMFGMSVNDRNNLYDVGAVAPFGLTEKLKRPDRLLVPADSTFSGFGLYRSAAVRAANASYVDPFPSHPNAEEQGGERSSI
jgi:glycosyltransferase involved in cell wall biosynthesis